MLVTLDHSTHTYTDKKGRLYKSVSSLLGEYKHPFEPHQSQKNGKTLIDNYTEKNGRTKEEWLELWDKQRDFACDRGHAFHSLKELIVANSPFVKIGNDLLPVRNINYIWNIVGEGRFDLLPVGVYTEVCVWNQITKVAGTMDLLIIYPNRKFSIKDYKTNGEFRTESYQNRPMKYPFTNYPDCHIGHYTVQLSLYAWLLEQYGYECIDLELLYYKLDGFQAALIMQLEMMPNDLEPVIYPVPYCSSEIDQVIRTRIEYLNAFKPNYR